MKNELLNTVGEHDAEEIQFQLEQVKSPINIAIPYSIAECMDRVAFLGNRQFCDSAEMGVILLHVNAACEHGDFKKLLNERGIHYRTAARTMAIAKMLQALPKSKSDKLSLLGLNQHQLSELTKVDVESIAQLDDEDFSILSETSGSDIKKQVVELINSKDEAQQQAAAAINELEHERLRKAPSVRFDMPVFISEIRKDAIAYTELFNDALSNTTNQITQLCDNRTIDFDSRVSAAQVLHHTWASMYMQIGTALTRLSGEFKGHIEGIEHLPKFDAAEWQYIDTERERMLETFQLNLAAKGGE